MIRAMSTSQNSASLWALLIKVDFCLLNLSLLLGGLIAIMRGISLKIKRVRHTVL
jgi:hypothetical protein